jgi:hypothetical protein
MVVVLEGQGVRLLQVLHTLVVAVIVLLEAQQQHDQS